MFYAPAFRPSPAAALWIRFAVVLSFLAVLLALISPISRLVEAVRTGQLGGVCSLNALTASVPNAGTSGDSNAPATRSHCDGCGSLAFALPLLTALTIPSSPGSQVAAVSLPADVAASSVSLPFSRGPPAL